MKAAPGEADAASKGPLRFTKGAAWSTVSVRAANVEAVQQLLRAVVFAILLTRAASEPLLNLSGGGGGASSMGLGAVLNVLVILIALVFLIQKPLIAPFPVIGIWAPFLLVSFDAIFYAPDFVGAARLAFVLLSYWALFAIPFFIWRSSQDLPRFVLLVIGSSIAPSLYAFVDMARGLSNMGDFRLQSTFSHPNIYAFYLVLLVGLSLYVLASRVVQVTPRVRVLIGLYMPLLVVFLMLTKTRSAWMACGLMFSVYAFRVDRRFFLGFLLVPILLVADPSLRDRLTDVTEAAEVESFKQLNENVRLNSYAWRQALWESAIPQILNRPMLGHGLESFKPSTPSFFPLIGPEGIDGHNFYLQVAFEMGFLGVFALVWLLGSVALRIVRASRRDPPGMMMIQCIFIGYLIESFSDNMQFYLSFNWYFWFVVGTIWVWTNHVDRMPALSRADKDVVRFHPRRFRA